MVDPSRSPIVLLNLASRCVQVYGIATEDMDALTFATPRLIRNLCTPVQQKVPINEYEYEKVIEGLKLTQDQFIDFCILCGCDYCGSIKGGSGFVLSCARVWQ